MRRHFKDIVFFKGGIGGKPWLSVAFSENSDTGWRQCPKAVSGLSSSAVFPLGSLKYTKNIKQLNIREIANSAWWMLCSKLRQTPSSASQTMSHIMIYDQPDAASVHCDKLKPKDTGEKEQRPMLCRYRMWTCCALWPSTWNLQCSYTAQFLAENCTTLNLVFATCMFILSNTVHDGGTLSSVFNSPFLGRGSFGYYNLPLCR